MNDEKHLRIGILGIRGIGQIHARILHNLGANICSILGSSMDSAKAGAEKLQSNFGISTQPFDDLETLMTEVSPDGVVVSTPAKHHFDQIITLNNYKTTIFCEKPLFWEDNIDSEKFKNQLCFLKNNLYNPILTNTSNSLFVEYILGEYGLFEEINSFVFKFYTQGNHSGLNIASDLLPHALSLLIRLSGTNRIDGLKKKHTEHLYQCSFHYGNCYVEFDLRENPQGPKRLAFKINERHFERIQKGYGATYEVFIEDRANGHTIKVEDPFISYNKQFIKYCNGNTQGWEDQWNLDLFNIELMGDILNAKLPLHPCE